MEINENLDRDSIDRVLDEFDRKKDTLKAFCIRAESLIEDCLSDANLRFQSIQARVKRRDKLGEKYLNPKKNYKRLDDITDQAALRVILYYDDDVDRAADIIKREFSVVPELSVDKRETEPDRFGYYALNFVCTLSDKRKDDVQFKKYADLKFEIQVTSVLRHAWSEIEHEWYDLQDSYPADIKRKFYRLAALLEIAESEFLTLRNQKINYQRSVDVRVEADVRDIPIDTVSLSTFIEVEPATKELDKIIAELTRRDLMPAAPYFIQRCSDASRDVGFKNLEELRRALTRYRAALTEYITKCMPIWGTAGSTVSQGASIFHLTMLLIGSQGVEKLRKFVTAHRIFTTEPAWLEKQALIAAEVLGRHG